MKYNRQMIIEQYNRGEKMDYVFFWGHRAEPGVIQKTCFSQRLGHKVRNFDSKVWDEKKYQIVLNGNIAKFSQNPEQQIENNPGLFRYKDIFHMIPDPDGIEDISSTLLREMLAVGNEKAEELVTPGVWDILMKEKLPQ